MTLFQLKRLAKVSNPPIHTNKPIIEISCFLLLPIYNCNIFISCVLYQLAHSLLHCIAKEPSQHIHSIKNTSFQPPPPLRLLQYEIARSNLNIKLPYVIFKKPKYRMIITDSSDKYSEILLRKLKSILISSNIK